MEYEAVGAPGRMMRRLSGPAKVSIGVCGGIILLVSVILFSVSWDTIEPTQFGFKYNSVTGNIDTSKVYGGGRYFVGLGRRFIKFPSTYVTMEFSYNSDADSGPVATRTNDGVALTLCFSFQYRFQQELLEQVYLKYAQSYEQPMIRVARNNILAVAGNYSASEYWEGRRQISDQMGAIMQESMSSNMYVDVSMFQLLNVQLPDKYESSIIATQVQQQQVKQQGFTQQVQAVEMQINQINATAQQNVTIILAQANAAAIAIQNQAQREAFNFTQTVQANSYAFLAQTLNLNTTQILRYMKMRGIRNKQSGAINVGLTDS